MPFVGVRPVRIERNDPLPPQFVEELLSLVSPDDARGSDANERTSKRRKLNEHIDSFCVAKGKIVLKRSVDDGKGINYSEKCFNVGHALSIYTYGEDLHININRVFVSFKLSPQQLRTDFRHILRLSEGKPNATPGSIWNNVDLSFDRQGNNFTTTIECQLYWNITPSPLNGFRLTRSRHKTKEILDLFFLEGKSSPGKWSPMDFYAAAHVPRKDDEVSQTIVIPGMDAILFPYQKRTVQWLLGREGVRWSEKSLVERLDMKATLPLSDSAQLVPDMDGKEMYVNKVFHTISTSNEPYRATEDVVKGGILAEEMGLGKTLEIIGLVLLHNRSRQDMETTRNRSAIPVPSGATLIVTPESLRQQWLSELSRHAPGLRFEFYSGWKREGHGGEEVVRRLAECDVVVTTYSILSAELHFTKEPPERSRRQARKYERAKSPLTEIQWWRLCLDEAQMIENGISQAATVACTIPRVNAWAITGTPVKDDVKDLYGLLSFLRYEPICTAPQIWQTLLQGHKDVFQKLFNTISLRHTKALVRDEISLPPQRRFAISVPFTAVEEQHYQSLFKEMCEACDLDAQGNPAVEGFKPDNYVDLMRTWLNRLRQTALHPEVGAYSRRTLGQNRTRPLRTVEEVLDAMIEQSEASIRADQRALLLSKLTRGQLYENSPRVREALTAWEESRAEVDQLVSEAREGLRIVLTENASEASAQKRSRDLDSSEDSEDDAELDESKGSVSEARRKLRSALELQHKAVFFCANAFFQIRDNREMTEPDSDEFKRLKKLEDEGYEGAKEIRREILRESHRKATKLMKKIARKASGQSFTEISELSVRAERGIESGRIVDNLEELYLGLNSQANVLDDWRERSVQLLLQTLLDEEDDVETTGEEMGDTVKMQDEMVIYIQVLRSAIADRHDAMTGQTNELVHYEAQQTVRMAKDGEGPLPEKVLELFDERKQIDPRLGPNSMRGAISELRSLTARLRNDPNQTERVRAEYAIAMKHLQHTQAALMEQTKAITALEAEIESFRNTMNARLEYYRQLQSVSDSVSPYEGPKTEEALSKLNKTEETLKNKLASAESKHRYLLHLKEAGSRTNEPRICVICQMPFETGVLTVCGHQFCKECMMIWYRAHRNCPVCKRHLSASQLHDIAMKPQELRLHGADSGEHSTDQDPKGGQDGFDKKTMIYSRFNSEKLAEIKNIELDGPSYTSKVDTLIRHLLWLRQTDPGAKSIVFSQYKDFLGVLSNAFQRFRIGYASIDSPDGTTRFKQDASVEVFLLHARAHSSGLNLVNANNVFLCEPLLNTAIELQAIARVDRIGQQHETTVWLYVTSGTVEESIYNLSVKRRMEHMDRGAGKGKSKESTPELLDVNLEKANTLELEQAALTKLMSKDRSAGEVVDKSDLWECLFGHVKREASEVTVA